jgi:glycosyltransferase involved in cell wall biosynthesis
MKICFFAPLADREAFHYNQFYAQDVRILEALSDELVLATRWSEIPWDADLYFVWWWTWAFLPLLKAKLRGRPVVITGVLDLDNPMQGIGFFTRPLHQRLLLRLSLGLADVNLFVSDLEYRRVPALLATRHPTYAPLVVETALHPFSPGPRLPFLLTICWLHGENPLRKGVDLSIQAHAQLLADHPGLELVVAGAHGDAVPELQALAESLGSSHRVRFPGRIDHAEKVRLLQTCSAYLQPSSFEGFGVAAAEAMASGAPVVASREGTLPEVLGGHAHFLEARTPSCLAETIGRVLAHPDPAGLVRAAESIRVRFSAEARRAKIASILDGCR